MVYGQASFESRIPGLHMIKARGNPGFVIAYGYRDHGDTFLVHRRDIQISPHLYAPVETKRPPQPKTEPPPRPTPLVDHSPVPVVPSGEKQEPVPVTVGEAAGLDLRALPGVTPEIAAQLEGDGIRTRGDILSLGVEGLKGYRGIGEVKANTILGALGALEDA